MDKNINLWEHIKKKPIIDCPKCNKKMIVYTIEYKGETKNLTIHKCGVPEGYK